MLRCLLSAVFFYPLLSLALPDAAVIVSLHGSAEVPRAEFVLGDIADLDGTDDIFVDRLAQTSLGSVVDVRVLSRAEITARLNEAWPDHPEIRVSGAPYTRVSLRGRPPDKIRLAATVRAHLAEISAWSESEIEVRSMDLAQEIEVPGAGVEFRIPGRLSPANLENLVVPIEALVDGEVFRIFWVKADVQVLARVVRAKKPVGYRSVINPSDLEEAVCEISDLQGDYARSLSEAAGKIAKRALSPGEIVDKRWLDYPDLVQSGDTIRLVLEGDSISLSTLGRALQSGKLGERIKVRNIDSRRALTATVTGPGEARVVH